MCVGGIQSETVSSVWAVAGAAKTRPQAAAMLQKS
jgi:hypothetical protein